MFCSAQSIWLCSKCYPLSSVFALLRLCCSSQNFNCVFLIVLCVCSKYEALRRVLCFAHYVMLRVLCSKCYVKLSRLCSAHCKCSTHCVMLCAVCYALLSLLCSARHFLCLWYALLPLMCTIFSLPLHWYKNWEKFSSYNTENGISPLKLRNAQLCQWFLILIYDYATKLLKNFLNFNNSVNSL